MHMPCTCLAKLQNVSFSERTRNANRLSSLLPTAQQNRTSIMMSTTSFSYFIVVTTVAVIACFASGTKIIPCSKTSKHGDTEQKSKINKLTVSPCAAFPCQLKKGTNVSVAVDFTMDSKDLATNATTSVHGIVAGVPLPYKTDYYRACQKAGLSCPLKPSSENIYMAKLYVSKLYPSLNLYVEWALLDQNQAKIFCFEIPVQIVS